MQLSTDIQSIFILILVAFTLGSTFLSAYSILNAIRLRNVRMSWKAGKLWGYPLFSTIFLLTSLIVMSVVYQMSLDNYYPVTACYIWIGLNWFVASYLASKRYITDHGIVKNINDPSQTVAWYQVTDFVIKPPGDESAGVSSSAKEMANNYIFIYQDSDLDERRTHSCIRLELNVPGYKNDDFKKIVSYKLGKTISPEIASFKDAGAVN